MIYPRIYSLSTVGIVKHYVHDYLFHPSRTDFIGPNGVGKSIIADLMQLIFIYDTDAIQFGTDGLKSDKRSIYTLPYKSSLAYCFLNIEIEEGKYIVIGIMISTQKGRRIMPFVITKKPDLNLARGQLVLNKEDLFFAKEILTENKIPDITDLAKKLFKDRDLSLNYFKNKDEVYGYYKFLYEKNILPINLSIEKNFIAFSKVIQSFSKAKTLDLSGNKASKSLKEFLFEDSDEDLVSAYNNQQVVLDRILKDYSRLDLYIKELEKKQLKLTELRAQEKQYILFDKNFRKTALEIAHNNCRELGNTEEEGKEKLSDKEIQYEILKLTIDKLPRIEKLLTEAQDKANKNYDLHIKYETLCKVKEELDDALYDLKMIIIPRINDKWTAEIDMIDMEIYDNAHIKEFVNFAMPYLKKFESLEEVCDAVDAQNKIIDALKMKLNNDFSQNKKLLNLLEQKEGIIHWFINQQKTLTPDQLQALIYFASTPISSIEEPAKNSRYVNPEDLFKDFEISAKDKNNGYWIKLGASFEYITFNPDADLFKGNKNIERSVKKLIAKLNIEIEALHQQVQELDKLTKVLPYDNSFFEYDFDASLIEFSNIARLKKAVACILQFEEKKDSVKAKIYKNERELATIQNEINTDVIGHEPEVVKKELDKIRKILINRIKKFAGYSGKKSAALETVEKDIAYLKRQLLTISSNLLKEQEKFQQLNSAYFKKFKEQVTEFALLPETIEEVEEKYSSAFEKFKSNYNVIAQQFDETSNGKNVAVNFEIDKVEYSFKVLEQALLGSKIKSTDDIAGALSNANQNRLHMADGIRDSMIKVFENTISRYKKYKEQVQSINIFFKDRKISNRFLFKLDFIENKVISIAFVDELSKQVRLAAKQGELPFYQSVDDFIEDVFKKLAKLKEKVPIDKLLNPKTYFDLSVSLTDENDVEIPGSTGETYSAIALLGIARLSVVQKDQRYGLRFIILEEIGSLDNTNFNTFPAIAEEFGYQIITMAPYPFNIGLSDEWYAHHLIKGNVDENINFHPSGSYFKTKGYNEKLDVYLNRLGK